MCEAISQSGFADKSSPTNDQIETFTCSREAVPSNFQNEN